MRWPCPGNRAQERDAGRKKPQDHACLGVGQAGAGVVGKVEVAIGVVAHPNYRAIIAQVAIALLTLVQ